MPRFELFLGRTEQNAIDDHPLTDEKISSPGPITRQTHITNQTDEETIAQHIGDILLYEADIVSVIGPFFEEIECTIEERLRDKENQCAEERPVGTQNQTSQEYGCVIEEQKDKTF